MKMPLSLAFLLPLAEHNEGPMENYNRALDILSPLLLHTSLGFLASFLFGFPHNSYHLHPVPVSSGIEAVLSGRQLQRLQKNFSLMPLRSKIPQLIINPLLCVSHSKESKLEEMYLQHLLQHHLPASNTQLGNTCPSLQLFSM